jgi:hypothetical protein
MRAREFLSEYRRDRTAQAVGNKLVAAFARVEKGHNVPQELYGAMTLAKMVSDPQLFTKGKSVTFDVMGTMVTVNAETAAEVLESQKPAIANAILAQLEDGDPTAHKEYTQWIAKMYIMGNTPLEDIGSTLKEYLYKFAVLKRKKLIKPPANDINRYSSFTQFMDVMDEYELPEDEIIDKGEATEVYEDATVRVVVPENQTAACYYGRGTRWCTAATKGSNYYSQYSRQGPLYILLPKSPAHPGERYQLHFPSEQYMDESDSEVDLYELIVNRFDLANFFKQQEPAISDYIVFADEAVVTPLLERIKDMAIDDFWDQVNEWEMHDEYWQDYRAEQARLRGYVDADGDIDWDQVMNDEDLGDYLDWNENLGTLRSNMETALNYSFDDIKSFVFNDQDGNHPEYENADLSRLSNLVSAIVRYECGTRARDDNIVSLFIDRHIDVRKTHKNSDQPWIVRRV